jgi:hypothetical protein
MDWSSFTRFKMMVQAVPRNLETSGLNQVALRASAKASAGHSLLSVPSLKSGSQVLLQGICRQIVSVLGPRFLHACVAYIPSATSINTLFDTGETSFDLLLYLSFCLFAFYDEFSFSVGSH